MISLRSPAGVFALSCLLVHLAIPDRTVHAQTNLEWGAISSPQTVGEPFAVTLTAKNQLDETVTNYAGTVSISATAANRLLDARFEDSLDGFTIDNTGGGLWHRSLGRGTNTGHSAFYGLYYGVGEGPSGGGDYDTGNSSGRVTSPPVDLSAVTSAVTLAFNYRLETEGAAGADRAAVQVSTNGTTFTTVASNFGEGDALTDPTGTDWAPALIDLSSYTGSTVQVRFEFDTVTGNDNAYEGWYVDDVVVSAVGTVPVAVTPTQAGSFTNGIWNGMLTVLETGAGVTLLGQDNGVSGIGAAFDVENATRTPWAAFASSSSLVERLVLDTPQTALTGGNENDMSGCAVLPESGELMVIQNGLEIIQVYSNLTYTGRTIDLPGFDDTEGMCLVKPEENLFAIVEEKIGEVTLVTITPSDTSVSKASGTTIDMGLPTISSNMEGLTYDRASHEFIVVKQNNAGGYTRGAYVAEWSGGQDGSRLLFAVGDPPAFDLGDVLFDPFSTHLLMVSPGSDALIETDLDGNVIATKSGLDVNRPEGLGATADMKMLYVISEPNELCSYRVPPQSGRGSEGTTLELEVRLSRPAASEAVIGFAVTSAVAQAGLDFSPASGTVHIPAGAVTGTVQIGILADAASEPDETITIRLTNAANAQLAYDDEYEFTIENVAAPQTITATAGPNGTIAPSGAVEVAFGGTTNFTITPDADYRVVDVVVDGGSVGATNSYTFVNVTTSHTIHATFGLDRPTLTVASGHGGADPAVGVHTNDYGTAVAASVTNSPLEAGSTQYVCTGWTLSGHADTTGASSGSGTSVSLTHTNHAYLAWAWETNYWLSVAWGSGGSVTPGSGWQGHGSNVVLTATPDPNWSFVSWTGDTNAITVGDTNTATITVAMDGALSLTAAFEEFTNDLEFVWDTIGSPQTVGVGFPVTLTVKDDQGDTFTSYADTANITATGARRLLYATFEDSLEGFTIDNGGGGLWHRSLGRGTNAGHSAFYGLYYGTGEGASGGGDYDEGITAGSATSPQFDLSAITSAVTLAFNYRLETEGVSSADRAAVQVSTDGTNFTTVASNFGDGDALTDPTGTDWVAASVDLSSYTGSTLQVRFDFDSVTAATNAYEGWYVDDVTVTAAGTAAVAITPTQAGGFVNGVWSGTMTVLEPNVDIVLLAEDTNGVSGTSATFDVETATRTPWAAFASSSSLVERLVLDTPQTLLPDGVAGNMSGCALMPASGELMVIQNNPEVIQVYSNTVFTGRNITLNGFQDTEGMCPVRPEEDLFAIVEERRAHVTIVTITPSSTTVNKSSGTTIDMGIQYSVGGMEGVTYDRATHRFVAVKQHSNIYGTQGPYVADWSGGQDRGRLLFALGNPPADELGDIVFDPYSTHLLMVSPNSDALIETDLDGNVIAVKSGLDVTDPEGLGASEDMKTLYVISEPNELCTYTVPRQSGRGDEGSTLELEIRLSRPAAAEAVIYFGVTGAVAQAGVDYAPASGTVTIPAGEVSGTLQLSILADAETDIDETITIALTNAANAQLAYDDEYELTINDVEAPLTVYASPDGGHVSPFATWADAATNIQDAVDVCVDGCTVMVTNAVYTLLSAVEITNGVTLMGVRGSAPVLDGNGLTRCLYLDHANAVVDGFELRDGAVTAASPHGASGGGVYVDAGGTLRNCLVRGNTATNAGGGVYLAGSGSLEHCTVSSNSVIGAAGDGGGVYCETGGTIVNSIVYGNAAGSNVELRVSLGATTVSYTCSDPAPTGTGNTGADPLFVNYPHDFRLEPGSPCVNAGQDLPWSGTGLDLDGNARRIDGAVDMGAYESTYVGITATAGANGSISPSGTVYVAIGGGTNFAIVADADYTVFDVFVDGASVGATNAYTFTNVTNARTIHAEFVLEQPELTVASAHGGAEPAVGIHPYAYGTTVPCAVTNSPVVQGGTTQYVCSGWTLSGNVDTNGAAAGSGTNVTLTLTNHASLAWGWQTNYWLQTAGVAGGSVTPVSGWQAAGSNVVLTAVPDVNRRFAHWTGDVGAITVGDTNTETITVGMTAPLSLTAHFEPGTNVLEFVWEPIDSPRQVGVAFGATIRVQNVYGTPKPGYTGTVTLSGAAVGQRLLTATFEDSLDGFTIDNAGGGLWHRSLGRGTNAGHSAFYSLYYGTGEGPSGGGDYDAGATAGSATSPELDLSAITSAVTLAFNYRLETEGVSSVDRAAVQVSTDGTNYTTVASNFGAGEALSDPAGTNWSSAVIDLSAYTGSTVRVRFDFDSVSASNNAHEGWYVDDVSVTAAGAVPAAITPTAITSFVNGVWSGNLTVLESGTDVVLTAEDGDGWSGSSAAFDVEFPERTPWAAFNVPTAMVERLELTVPGTALTGGVTNQMSGGAILAASGELMVVQNNSPTGPRIQVYSNLAFTGRAIGLEGFVDTEGMCPVKPELNEYAVVEEGRAEITILDIPPGVTNVAKASGVTLDMGIAPYLFSGMEGVAYDRATHRFMAVKQTSDGNGAMGVYLADWSGGQGRSRLLYAVDAALANELGGLVYDPFSTHLLIAAPGSNVIIEADLDGNVLGTLTNVNVTDPEGLAASADLKTLYAIGEPNEVCAYELATPSASATEGTTLQLALRLSRPATSAVSIDFAVTSAVAQAGSDFSPATGTVTIAAGAVEGTLEVQFHADDIVESNETIVVRLTGADGAVLAYDDVYEASIVNVAGKPTHYVAHGGAHVAPFMSWQDAATNVQAAIDAATPGHRVLVTNATFVLTETVRITNGITVVGVRGSSPVLDGGGLVRCLYLASTGAVVDGFAITGGYADELSALGPKGGGVYVEGAGTLRNCLIRGNTAHADGFGISMGGGAYLDGGGAIEHCTVVGNAAEGFSPGGGIYADGGGTIVNSIVYDNTSISDPNLRLYGAGNVVEYSCVDPVPAGDGNTGDDPQFTNPGSGDYRPAIGSPCIDTGTNLAWASTGVDLDGDMRVINGTADMGAYESATLVIAATAGSFGSISPSGSVAVAYGSDADFTITPDARYHVSDVTVDGVSIGATNFYRFTSVASNHTIHADFAINRYTLDVVSPFGGAVPAVGSHAYDDGTTVDCGVTNSPIAIGTTTQIVCTGWALSGHADTNGATSGSNTNVTLVMTNDAALGWAWQTNYWLETVAAGGGMVTPSPGWQTAGSNVVVTASGPPNRLFVGWSGDTDAIVAGDTNTAEITVLMDRTVAVTAAFEVVTRTLDVASAHGGAVPPVGHGVYEYGTALACQVTNSPIVTVPQGTQQLCTGWTLVGQTDDTGNTTGAGTSVDLTLTNNSSLTWNWQTQYWLGVTNNGGGSVTPGSGWHNAGTPIILQAIPAPHHTFTEWTGDTDAIIVFDAYSTNIGVFVDKAVSLTANFEADKHTLNVVSAFDGAVPGVGSNEYDYGSLIDCYVTNSPIWDGVSSTQIVCVGWELTGQVDTNGFAAGSDTNVVMTLTNDATLAWGWETNYWLGVTNSGPGSAEGGGWQPAGSNVTVEATPDAHYHFVRWEGDTNAITGGDVNSATVTVGVTGPFDLAAVFDINRYVLDVASAHGGAVPAVGSYTNDAGTTVACAITNSPLELGVQATQVVCGGWALVGHADTNGAPAGAGTAMTLTLTNDAALAWQWSTNYWLATAASGGGSVTPSGWHAADSNAVVAATADAHRHFVRWTGDTHAIVGGDANSATVTVSMTTPVALTAEFELDSQLLVVASAHGGADPAEGTNAYLYGTQVAAAVTNSPVYAGTQATQYVCTGWTLSGNVDTNGLTSDTGTNLTLVLTNDAALAWSWQTNYWLATTNDGPGTTAPADGWHPAGSNVVLVATPDAHYEFAGWEGDTNAIVVGNAGSATVAVEMASELLLTARFSLEGHDLVVVSPYGGADPAVGLHGYQHGTSLHCEVTNSPVYEGVMATQHNCTGWTLAGITDDGGNGSGAGTAVDLTLTNDATLTWNWDTKFWIDVDRWGTLHGTAGVFDGYFSEGQMLLWPVMGYDNHHYDSISGDTNGVTVNVNNPQFVMLTIPSDRPRRITANFVLNRHTLEVVSPFGGAVPPVGSNVFDYGSAVPCAVTNSPIVVAPEATQIVCTGWALVGNTATNGSASGSGTSTTVRVTADGSLTWLWETNYWVNTEVAGNGSVNPNDGWVSAGSNVVVEATPDAHHHFTGWTGSGTNLIEVGDVNSATVTVRATAPVELTANFAIDEHTYEVVSAHDAPTPPVGLYTNIYGTTVSNSVGGVDMAGTTQYVSTGWTLVGVTSTGGMAWGADTNVVLTLTNDAVLTWGWSTNYWLDTEVAGNGSVGPTDHWVSAGSNVVVKATPAAHHHFTGWSGPGTNLITVGDVNSATVTVTATAPVELTANFAIDQHTLQVVSAHGAPLPAVGVYTNAYGTLMGNFVDGIEEVGTTQYVSTGWTLSGSTDNGGRTMGPDTNIVVVLTNDAVLTWGWSTNYWLNTEVAGNGSVEPADQWVSAGSNAVVKASPAAHHHFAGWSGSGTNLITVGDINSATVTVAVTAPVELTANFAIDRHTYEVVSAHDAPMPVVGVYTNAYGTTISNSVTGVNTIGATQYVATGWTLAGVTDTGGHAAGADTNVVLVLTNDAVLTWGWSTNYWLNTEVAGNGSVEPADQWVSAGSNAVVKASPAAHHHFAGWSGSGTNLITVGDVNSATVTVTVTAPVELTANFAIDRHTYEVVSAHDAPMPAVGVYTNAYGTTISNSVTGVNTIGATQYVATGWTLAGVTDTGGHAAGADTNVVLVLTNDAVLTWGWSTNYWLDTEVAGNGSVDPTDDWVSAGSNVVVKATPDARNRFTGWSGSGTNLITVGDVNGATVTVVATGPVELTASFEEIHEPEITGIDILRDPHRVVLEWPSRSNYFYSIELRTSLLSGGTTPLAVDLPATPPLNVYTDGVERTGPVYYRVRVQP